MELSFADIERVTGGSFQNLPPGVDARTFLAQRVLGWSIDSRSVRTGDLFFAIPGERFDGHAFLQNVLDKGGTGAVVSETAALRNLPLLQVGDTVTTLGQVAREARRKWNKPVVAVTGSAGKTSTKDVIAALLGVRFRVGKTAGNLNNHLGLPLTLLRIPAEAEVAVVELGMNHAGEIRTLAQIAQPRIGVVTNVGYAHIEAFTSIEEVAAAKRELVEQLPSDGTAVLNADDARVARFQDVYAGRVLTFGIGPGADVRGVQIESGADSMAFTVAGVRFSTKLTGAHSISNILAGIAVAGLFDIQPSQLVEAVAQLGPGKMRGECHDFRGVSVLDDSYNSNPAAAISMLDVLLSRPAKRHIAVLGEMLELGPFAESLHRELGRYAADHAIDVLVAVGGASRFIVEEAVANGLRPECVSFFEDAESAGGYLRGLVRPGDAVLFKGSRGTHVERALARMEE